MFQSSDPRVSHVHHVPARSGRTAPWPMWVPDDVRESLGDLGITTPWEHQARAMEAAHAGKHVLLSTGSASGKSLAYLAPVVTATRAAADQLDLPIGAAAGRAAEAISWAKRAAALLTAEAIPA